MYKLPPLSVFVSEAKKAYDLMAKMGLVQGLSWEDHLRFSKSMYKDMQDMDPVKLDEFIETRSRQRVAVLKSFKEELDKNTGALDARKRLEDAARQAAHK
jgi:hypothetical protein